MSPSPGVGKSRSARPPPGLSHVSELTSRPSVSQEKRGRDARIASLEYGGVGRHPMNQERLPMKSTLPRTRPARREEEGYVIDLDALGRRLVSLTDTRCSKGLRYHLPPLLLLIVLAKLAG